MSHSGFLLDGFGDIKEGDRLCEYSESMDQLDVGDM
jgi:hypothetical protein